MPRVAELLTIRRRYTNMGVERYVAIDGIGIPFPQTITVLNGPRQTTDARDNAKPE